VLLLPQLHLRQKGIEILHRHGSHLINIFIRNRHCQRLCFQPLSLTGLAGGNPHELLIFLLHDLRTGLPVLALHVFDQSLKGNIINAFPALSSVMDFHFPAVRSVDQDMADFLRVFAVRRLQRKMILLRQRL